MEFEATISELTEDSPAELAFYTLKLLKNGQEIPCTQVAQVQDEGLLVRLRSLKPGDRIQVFIETDWSAQDIPTVLKDFRRI